MCLPVPCNTDGEAWSRHSAGHWNRLHLIAVYGYRETVSGPKNAFYAQSGGMSAVINASACGVIETAREYKGCIAKVLAGQNGIVGALGEELIDTHAESAEYINALRHTPGGAFGSCRYKLPGLKTGHSVYRRLREVLLAHDIGYFFYNGGGDSADTCAKVAHFAKQARLPLQVIHIPKTVDNDIPGTDVCPGFSSAAKYVAVSLRETCLDVRAMARSSTKVFVLEVMGRHAGWIAAAGGLAGNKDYPLPVLILFPEIGFDQDAFLTRVKHLVETHEYCAVVVSEGVRWPNGRFLSDQGEQDAFGHVQLGGAGAVVAGIIKRQLGYKPHWAVADYLQRAARHIASAVDSAQAYAVGKAAVDLAIQGENGIMTSILRKSDTPYVWEVGKVPLKRVIAHEKKLPKAYIGASGFQITAACRRYLAPLIMGEVPPPFEEGLPSYVQLRNHTVRKKLPPFPAT